MKILLGLSRFASSGFDPPGQVRSLPEGLFGAPGGAKGSQGAPKMAVLLEKSRARAAFLSLVFGPCF